MGKINLLFVLSVLLVAQLFANGIDQTKFQNQKVFTNNISGSYFGFEAKSIGDFNCDGYGDLAVGAEGENSSTGAVYIYFGGEEFNTTADVVLKGYFSGEGFGHAVSPAGDFNGDGFEDLMISSYSSTGSFVQIYFGGPWFDLYPDVTIPSVGTDIFFAYKISKLGDVNGDNFDDIAIKANGKVHIYYGKSVFTTVLQPDYSISVDCSDLTYAGDVNGDGFEDIAVANEASSIVYVYAGGMLLSSTPGVTFIGNYGSHLGYSISGGKDINRDGFSDIIVGAPSEGQNGTNSGAAYIYYGSANILNNNGSAIYSSVQIYGNTAGAKFGNNVQFLSDVNGDGFDETAVGNHFIFASSSNSVNIYFGDYQFSGATNSVINSDGEYYFGAEIASTDFDGDGYSEIFVSAPYNDKVYSYSLKMRGVINFADIMFDATFNGTDKNIRIGDFNGDGFDDVIYYKSSGLFIKLGSENINNEEGIATGITTAFSTKDKFIGDFDGDGFEDFVKSGKIYWGTDDLSNIQFAVLPANMNFADCGDSDGDGKSDLVYHEWTEPNQNGDRYDSKYLCYGNSSRDITSAYSFSSWTDNAGIGSKVQFADINGDGFDDITFFEWVTGDYYVESRLKVSFGNQSRCLSWIYDLDLDGNPTLDNLHLFSLHNIGDFNDDGCEELLINLGNPSIWTPVSKILSWNKNNQSYDIYDFTNYFTIYSNGDVNNDGFSDFIDHQRNIYFGNKNFELIKDLHFSGYIVDENSINAYSSFIDFNGDGKLDVITQTDVQNVSIYLNSGFENAPGFLSVKDVPADQGGKVTLAWTKSALDGSNVTSYQIERSIAPVGSGFAWEVVGNVPTSFLNAYSFTAPTLSDQTPNYSGNTYFRITALTENPTVFYRSNILFGHSTDNLAPGSVLGLNASMANNSAKISWKLNSESDLKEYLIYRNEKDNVNLDTLVALATTTDSVFYDKTPLKSAYYFIVAKDIHDNLSEPNQILLKFTDIKNETEIIKDYALFQNYPNPFNPTTNIKFNLPKNEFVTLKIFDIIGNEVATLVNEQKSAGSFTIEFDASNLTSGIYLYQLQAGSFREIKKMMLIK